MLNNYISDVRTRVRLQQIKQLLERVLHTGYVFDLCQILSELRALVQQNSCFISKDI